VELLFVTLIGFGIGLGMRYVLPGHDTYGVVLVPAIAAAVTAIVWVGLTWLGWKFDGGWIWVVSLGAAAVVTLVLALILPRVRRTNDDELLQKLSRA
jgi:NADH:ubiquinone oxidoreductase subunit 6 (subunit J)